MPKEKAIQGAEDAGGNWKDSQKQLQWFKDNAVTDFSSTVASGWRQETGQDVFGTVHGARKMGLDAYHDMYVSGPLLASGISAAVSLRIVAASGGGQRVGDVGDDIKTWLGDGYIIKRSDAKGFVAMSKDGKKIFRADIDGHGDKPHAHFEVYDPRKNKHVDAGDKHRYYFQE